MHPTHSIALWPTLIVLVIATISDIRTRRIPNRLVFPFLAAGVIVNGVAQGMRGVAQSAAGIGIAAAVLGVLCYLRGMGMGDLKLFAAVGAWIGPSQLITALVATAMAGGFLALAYALWNRSLGKCIDGAGELMSGFFRDGFRPHKQLRLENAAALKVPYAAAIAIGTMFSFYAL